jgi:hypothetical protein
VSRNPDPDDDWFAGLEEARKPWGRDWPHWLSATDIEIIPDDWRD